MLNQSDVIAEFDRLYDGHEGTIRLAWKDRSGPDHWQDIFREYPKEKNSAAQFIAKRVGKGYEVFRATALLEGPEAYTALPSNILSFEIDDADGVDWELLRKFTPRVHASGTPGHHHVEIHTDTDLPATENGHLARWIASACGITGHHESGGKFQPHEALRFPGSYNTKPRYATPPGEAVEVTVEEFGEVISMEALKSILSDYEPPTESTIDGVVLGAEEIDEDALPRSIRDQLRHDTDDDSERHNRHYMFVGDMYAEYLQGNITPEQAKYVSIHYYVPIQSKWPPVQRAEDFDRLWAKHAAEKVDTPKRKARTSTSTGQSMSRGKKGNDNEDNNTKRLFTVETAENAEMKLTRWLWDESTRGAPKKRVPLGALSLIASYEGSKKSMVCVDLAARVTRGELRGECFGTPRSVIYLATEDDWEATVVPRLAAANADLSRVIRIQPAERGMPGLNISDPDHLEELRQIIEQRDVALIVLDPIIAAFGGRIVEKEEVLRDAFAGFIDMLQDLKMVSALGIKHFTKIESTDPSVLMGGVRTWSALARSFLAVAPHPDDVEAGVDSPRMILGVHKVNLTLRGGASVYEAREKTLRIEDRDEPIPHVVWLGDSPWTPAEALAETARRRRKREQESKPKKVTAKTWLVHFLSDAHTTGNGYVLRTAVIEAGKKEQGFSPSSLDKAYRDIRDEGNTLERKVSSDGEAYWGVLKSTVVIA